MRQAVWAGFRKIVSGGQSGVDRAGLDAALALNIPCGGWCPQGRKAEDGVIDQRYPLVETDSDNYSVRTAWNVRDSDGTLIFNQGELEGGTAETVDYALQQGKPCLVVSLDQSIDIETVIRWINDNRIATLNIAGPRESKWPGIQQNTQAVLLNLLRACSEQ
ncbi:MAG: putative molybdenum carrier protein [Chromatiales bacterium]|nr:putative molybdenum carrier protein [Chromatiales bacterium]